MVILKISQVKMRGIFIRGAHRSKLEKVAL